MPTTNLGLTYLVSAQNQPEVTLNANADLLDALVVRKTGDTLTGALKVLRTAVATGTPNADLWVQTPADTNLTNAESVSFLVDGGSATRQFAGGGGAIANQRLALVNGPTYSAAAAQTITNAATLHVFGSPVAGTNVTLTNSAALWVQGAVVFGSNTVGTTKAGFTFAQGQNTTQPTAISVTPSASGTLTASTEAILIAFNLARTVTFATGALTTQREFVIDRPTYAFAAASVLTNAATVAIVGAPLAGTNATITNAYSVWCQAGTARFDGSPVFEVPQDTTVPTTLIGRVPVRIAGVTRFLGVYS